MQSCLDRIAKHTREAILVENTRCLVGRVACPESQSRNTGFIVPQLLPFHELAITRGRIANSWTGTNPGNGAPMLKVRLRRPFSIEITDEGACAPSSVRARAHLCFYALPVFLILITRSTRYLPTLCTLMLHTTHSCLHSMCLNTIEAGKE